MCDEPFIRYACGLVLWELASRCRVPGLVDQPPEYMLPFEQESGIRNPSLERMLVSHES